MTIFDEIKKKPEAAKLLNNKSAVEKVMKSPEAAKLADLLKNSGGNLEDAAKQAMSGDTTQLMGILNRIMEKPENAKIMEDLNRNLPK